MASAGRGGGWVWAQFALIVAIMAAVALPADWPAAVAGTLSAVGAILAFAGGALAVWAARSLGRALTPFPHPADAGELVEGGPFRWVRHPIYSGGLAFFIGWSLFAGPVALALTAVLGVLWVLKARLEERYLASRYPSYAAYSHRVRSRLLPGVY